MDGPAEANPVRAPKRPYPKEEDERQDVRGLKSVTSLLTYIS